MMSKFLAQLLLSVVLGVGATIGFKSDVRGSVDKILPEAKIAIKEKANLDFKSISDVKTQANTSVSISSKSKTGVSARVNLSSQVSTGADVFTDLIPNVSLDSSSDTNSQTNLGVGLQDLDLDIKNTLESTSELDLKIK
jgi:hypothetical protein